MCASSALHLLFSTSRNSRRGGAAALLNKIAHASPCLLLLSTPPPGPPTPLPQAAYGRESTVRWRARRFARCSAAPPSPPTSSIKYLESGRTSPLLMPYICAYVARCSPAMGRCGPRFLADMAYSKVQERSVGWCSHSHRVSPVHVFTGNIQCQPSMNEVCVLFGRDVPSGEKEKNIAQQTQALPPPPPKDAIQQTVGPATSTQLQWVGADLFHTRFTMAHMHACTDG